MQQDHHSEEKAQLEEALIRWVESEGHAWFQNVGVELARTYEEIVRERGIPVEIAEIITALEQCQEFTVKRVSAAISHSLRPAAFEPSPPPPLQQPNRVHDARAHGTQQERPPAAAQQETPVIRAAPAAAEELFPQVTRQNLAVRRSNRSQWSAPVEPNKIVREPRPDQPAAHTGMAHHSAPAPAPSTPQPGAMNAATDAQTASMGMEEVAMAEMLKGVAARLHPIASFKEGQVLLHNLQVLIHSMSQPGCLHNPQLRQQFLEMAHALDHAGKRGLLEQTGLADVGSAFEHMANFFKVSPQEPAAREEQDGRAPVVGQQTSTAVAADVHPFAQNLQTHFMRLKR
ncbi:hypothetical protein Mmc1_2243 [Magnetococcus marinus MC-1]|uniref:Uncharacterized protein n=1 Tax=Magnetococcus marinus (strain ATCC BAA-1437 / JCM 17883 / MC-1) TaxID=156889 RepID=A0L9V1_MAGMM|nr:hypothetical protein [Magnetococcus marinus]ABK44744.1 hypothetical protein Mmc1_2243 [Magnetococcus marinus MC-1]